jgi:hypothetical protein
MRGKKGIFAACVVAVLTFAIATGATATASPEAAKGGKRCKKKKHSSKRKCKKRKADAQRLPVIRATLSWSNPGVEDVDMDLFVFDGSGGVAGDGSDTIPLSTITPDVSGSAGLERFTDSLFTPQSARDLSFGVCYSAGTPVHTDFTLTYVTADGVVHGDSQSPGMTTRFDYPGGVIVPLGFCSR